MSDGPGGLGGDLPAILREPGTRVKSML